MAIHWQIKFNSIADELYTVNIYDNDYSGDPVQLIGASRPFTTQEVTDSDIFIPVRTQSGYLRFWNDGTVDWRSILPATDTDRPVTLTNSINVVVWQGFIQAQDFGTDLYITPKEIALPVQCALSTLGRIDVNLTTRNGLANFAAILDHALAVIPGLSFTNLYFQGGSDAQQWLRRRIDWDTFGETDSDGIFASKCSVLDAVESLCRYFGWTMRTSGKDIYFVSPDDSSVFNFLKTTRLQLAQLANGTVAGTIDTSGWSTYSVGDVFADDKSTDKQMRGCNKAKIVAESGDVDDKLIYLYPETVLKQMDDSGYSPSSAGPEYTQNIGSFTSYFFNGEMLASSIGSSYFNIAKYEFEFKPVIRQAVYIGRTPETFCILTTNKPYIVAGGEFVIDFAKYPTPDSSAYCWFGLQVIDEETSGVNVWNGTSWAASLSPTYFRVKSGAVIPTAGIGTNYGRVKLLIVGWDSASIADMSDLCLSFRRKSDNGKYLNSERRESNTYTAKNKNVVNEEWDTDCLYSTDNYSKFGSSVVINPDNTYFKGWDYGNHREATAITPKQQDYDAINLTDPTQPEQHLVNRVALYWNQSRRNIECNLRSNLIPAITPRYKITIDGSTMYPVSISHDWRDDVTQFNLMEI